MFQKFYPSEYVNSSFEINYKNLYKEGYRGLIFDVDNTLVEHGADASKEALALMKELKEIGFKVCFLSNNNEERVKRFNKDINGLYIFKANKPSKKGYQQAMKLMGTTIKNTVFIGDQLFTDVYGANRIGMKTFLVKPIGKKEEIQIVIKRYFERIVLFFYNRSLKK
ncbi:YqeG family HAD IIIA-type phosphatase [Clostridium sp. Marseille-P299]|uniref:YqeG family HAD IIIA-type phosphatase n=1 Tax=Clostridium sp. Marseille-P299 TaxID=1805477 RepID=UPI000835F36D|nr:YqeG family HAD IIIA-type phosphatase [Clostridium sp. Marseille-P299]